MIVKQGQSLLDIAIQEYGTAESIFNLVDDNKTIDSLTFEVSGGVMLNIYEHETFTDKRMRKYYKEKNIEPATDVSSIAYKTGWILEDAYWNDNGIWIDEEFWKDSL